MSFEEQNFDSAYRYWEIEQSAKTFERWKAITENILSLRSTLGISANQILQETKYEGYLTLKKESNCFFSNGETIIDCIELEYFKKIRLEGERVIGHMSKIKTLTKVNNLIQTLGLTYRIDEGFSIQIPFEYFDLQKARDRVSKDIDSATLKLKPITLNLNNPDFLKFAKPEVVEKTREQFSELTQTILSLEHQRKLLS